MNYLTAEICEVCHTAQDETEFQYRGRPSRSLYRLKQSVCKTCHRKATNRRYWLRRGTSKPDDKSRNPLATSEV